MPTHEELQARWAELNAVADKATALVSALPRTESLFLRDHDIRRAREVDPTGVTAVLFLRALANAVASETTISIADILWATPDQVAARLQPFRDVKAVLDTPAVREEVEGFRETVRAAVKHYGALGRPGIAELVTDDQALAELRFSALRAINDLEHHQFLRGASDPVPPQYNKDVFEFWNMPSLLRAMRGQTLPGITLCLVRDPEEPTASFFVLACADGENLAVLTDREKAPHPDYKHMTRRPDRGLARRADRFFFPYELLDVSASADGQGLHVNARDQLVPYDATGIPIAKVAELPPENVVWLALLFDLARTKLWEQKVQPAALSYTGEMIRVPNLLAAPEGALVKTGQYQPLEAKPLTINEVSADGTAGQWKYQSGTNRWAELRHAGKVPVAAYDLVTKDDVLRLASDAGSTAIAEIPGWKELAPRLRAMDPTAFGTATAMEADRQWAARMNQAIVVNQLVQKEHEQTSRDLIDWAIYRDTSASIDGVHSTAKGWYPEALLRRFRPLAEAAVRGSFETDVTNLLDPEGKYSFWNGRITTARGNILSMRHVKDGGGYRLGHAILHGGNPRKYTCALKPGTEASYIAWFSPNCPQAVADLLGMPVEDLPWQIRDAWHLVQEYGGNAILQRVDPMDWVVKNPWTNLPLAFGIALSKSGIATLARELGVPKPALPDPPPTEPKRRR